MEFDALNVVIHKQFARMCSTGKLFKSSVSGSKVWDTYLSSFTVENNKVFRDPESSEHNCNNCKNFIRRYGNIVSINEDGNLESIFTGINNIGEYTDSVKACNELLINAPIENVFFETYQNLNNLPYESCKPNDNSFQLGIASNYKKYTQEEVIKFGVVNTSTTYIFNHFHLHLPSKFVNNKCSSLDALQASYRDKKFVFKRAMEEIPLDTLILVRDLINQDSLLDGKTHLASVDAMIKVKTSYNNTSWNKDNWCWFVSYDMSDAFAKFKNTLIGVLCTELAEGMELNKACQNWNKRVDPINYHKAKSPITEAQRKAAEKYVIENGYIESFNRRLATLDDIKASEIRHINRDSNTPKSVTIFDSIKTSSSRHRRSEFDKVQEVGIDTFITDILPTCSSVELLLENRMRGNLVNLTTSINDSKKIFKWDNPFSYTFNGNLAGKSQLAKMVEAKGGRIDGVFRFTHSWNEIEPNQSLMDLHVFMPGCTVPKTGHRGPHVNGRRVGWNNRNDRLSGGSQDVDYTSEAPKGYIPVENITFPDLSKMPEGVYTCAINNWSFRHTGGKGRAEIAFNGELYQYEYPSTKQDEWIIIAEVTLKDGIFTIKHMLPECNSSVNLWGLDSNNFHKVNLICDTPNHWGDNNVGNKYHLFMLAGCKNPNSVRGFHNEHLISDLLSNRKVLDVLGDSALIEPTDNQIAGVGFNSTVRDEVILRISGSHKRVIKVKF